MGIESMKIHVPYHAYGMEIGQDIPLCLPQSFHAQSELVVVIDVWYYSTSTQHLVDRVLLCARKSNLWLGTVTRAGKASLASCTLIQRIVPVFSQTAEVQDEKIWQMEMH